MKVNDKETGKKASLNSVKHLGFLCQDSWLAPCLLWNSRLNTDMQLFR